MIYTIIDIETTGLMHEGARDILSVCYLSLDQSLMKKLDSGVMYFWREGQQQNKAEHINRLSEAFLKTHADKFEYNVAKLAKLYCCGNLIGHNIKRFDSPFIQNYLNSMYYGILYPNTLIDTMGYDRRKLGVVVEDMGYTKDYIGKLTKEYFGEENIAFTDDHDAAYDVMKTYLVANAWKMKGGF